MEAALGRLEGAGSGVVLVLSGEAGIGKTSLLAESCRLAEEHGALALSGRCGEFEVDLPYAGLVNALDDYLRTLPAAAFQPLEPAQRAELALLMPGYSAEPEDAPAGLQDERYRAHAAIRALLEVLAGDRPLLLAMDDVHWADEATAELLAGLVRRPPLAPVLIALSHRTGRMPPRIAAELDDLRDDAEAIALALGPLDREQALELLRATGSEADLDELLALSGGNPFYLGELARAGAAGAPDAPSDVPDRVTAALTAELDALPGGTRAVAEGAAVAGETFLPELAAEAAGVTTEQALEGVDELIERDLLRKTDVPRRFRFRHPIVHRAVYDSIGPGRRLAAHAKVAEALAEAGASPLARAPHVESSAQPGDRDAVEVLRSAGDAASLRAPAAAAHWYGAALRLLPEEATLERLSLMVPMAQSLGYAGRLEEARAVLEDVLLLLDPEETAVRGQVVAAAARLDQLLGRHAEALRLLTSTLDRIPDRHGPAATELKVQLTGACFFDGDFEGSKRWAREALEEATSRGDVATQAALTGSLGAAEYMTDDPDAARALLTESQRMMARLGDRELARRLHSVVWHGMCELYLERFDRATATFERGMRAARATGHGHVTTLNSIGLAQVALAQGRLADADELLESATEAATLTGNDQFLIWAQWVRSAVALTAGRLPDAVRMGEQAVARARGEFDPISAFAGCYLAEARLASGDSPAECRALLLGAVGGAEMALVERAYRAHWYEALTRIELAAGDTEAAAGWARRATAAADGMGIAGRSAEAARARAAVALEKGDPVAAARDALRSAEEAAAAGLPVDEARARILAGRALADSDRAAAIAQLQAAERSLEALGAARHRDEAARELRALGERVARPKRGRADIGEGVASLSEREEQVAALVAEGYTNKRIASELFLSEKTIEKHLSSIFGKLGVSKRAQVAAAIGRGASAARS